MTRRRSCSCTSIINHKIASAVIPNKELKGFREVFLCAGEKRACIPINVAELGSGIRTQVRYDVEEGKLVVAALDSAEGIKLRVSFRVI